jgi:hypothetical protein
MWYESAVLRTRALTLMVVALSVVAGASAASAQYTGRALGVGFFPAVPVRGPLVLYPTLTITGEFNDNVFLDNTRRESDFILGITPGVRLVLERATHRWAAGYSFTAEKYMDHPELDDAFQQQNFFIEGFHRIDPRLTLTLNEVFIEDKNSNLVTEEAVAIGRRTSRSNTFSPGLTWRFAPQTALRTSFSYVLQRFDDELAFDSNVYRLSADIDHDFTPRLTGSVGYEVQYLDVSQQLGVTTHTPRVGATYRFTPTLTGGLTVGPTVRVSKDESGVSPYVNAHLTNRYAWGSAGVYFTRYVGTAGGLGGTTENTSAGAVVQVTTLLRDLVLEFSPRYGKSESAEGTGIDVHSFSVDLRAAYRFTTWLAAVGGYRFFQQRSDSVSTLARDVDQNRVFLGLQFGLPIKFD